MSEVDIEKEADVEYPTSQISLNGQQRYKPRLPNNGEGSGSSKAGEGMDHQPASEMHNPEDQAGLTGEEFEDAYSTLNAIDADEPMYHRQKDQRRGSLKTVQQQKGKYPLRGTQDISNDTFDGGPDSEEHPNLKLGGSTGKPRASNQDSQEEGGSAALGYLIVRALDEYQQRQRLANATQADWLIERRNELHQREIHRAETEQLDHLQGTSGPSKEPGPSLEATDIHDYGATGRRSNPEDFGAQNRSADASAISRDVSRRGSFEEQAYTDSEASIQDPSGGDQHVQAQPPVPRRHVRYEYRPVVGSVVRGSPPLRSPGDNIETHWSPIEANAVLLGAPARQSRRSTTTNLRIRTDLRQGPGFLERMRLVYGKSVMRTNGRHLSVHIAEMTRVFLEYNQKRLLEAVFDFKYREDEDVEQEILQKTGGYLSDYVQAWKDLEFMTETRKTKGFDPFVLSTDLTMQRASLQEVQREWQERHGNSLTQQGRDQFTTDMRLLTEELALDRPLDNKPIKRFGGETRTEKAKQDWIQEYTEKVAMAVTGGAFLIAPMLVMVLHPGLVTSLVTTSACVFAFGLVMAIFLKAPFDVLSATAAYAAVMVVFIGTGTGSGP